jgi:hypothetical protein
VAVGLVAGLVVALGLLALELVGPGSGLDSGDPSLQRQTFDDLGFAISYPSGWTLQTARVQRLRAVTVVDPLEARAQRGFRVALDTVSLRQAESGVRSLSRDGRRTYQRISIDAAVEVAGAPALEHIYSSGGLRFEQWYVARAGGTYRIEFWAPVARAEEASTVNARVLDSFEIR